MRRSIEVKIDLDGATEIEAIGFHGKGCEDATRAFEQALGTVTKRTRKPEGNVRREQRA